MSIMIIMRDGSLASPAFSPEHRDRVIAFYSDMLEKGMILGWSIEH